MDVLAISERRRKPRIETKVRVRIGGRESESETYTPAIWSKSGIFLETKETFVSVGEKIQMQIEIPPSGEFIRVVGRVARLNGPTGSPRCPESPSSF